MFLTRLKQIIKLDKCKKIEFKATTRQRAEAAKAVCSFLNREGRYVIFGILDNREVKGRQVTARSDRKMGERNIEYCPMVQEERQSSAPM